jgi:hypothetical protein
MEQWQVDQIIQAASDHVVNANGARLCPSILRDAFRYPSELNGDDIRIVVHPVVLADYKVDCLQLKSNEMWKQIDYKGSPFVSVQWMPITKVLVTGVHNLSVYPLEVDFQSRFVGGVQLRSRD